MTSPLKPALLKRDPRPTPWGGRALVDVLGLELPDGRAIGETWELFDRPGASSGFRDQRGDLAEWMARDPEALLGSGVRPARGNRFPLLVKLIDARKALSVQVHPGDEQAAEQADAGKHEGWVVLHAGPAARIIRGLREGVTRESFEGVAHTPDVEQLLCSFQPRVGDVVDVPPGTVHSIGPDVVLYEIQQNSEVTYRLWDWGSDRETHVEQGLRAMRYEASPSPTVSPQPAGDGAEWLLRNRHFTLRRLVLREQITLGTEDSFKIATLLTGRCSLGWRSGGEDAPLLLAPGDTVLIPACIEHVFVSPLGRPTMLWAGPGQEA